MLKFQTSTKLVGIKALVLTGYWTTITELRSIYKIICIKIYSNLVNLDNGV